MQLVESDFNFDLIQQLYTDREGLLLAWPKASFPVEKPQWQEWFEESDYQKVFSLFLKDHDKVLGHIAVKKYKMYPGLCYLCFIYVDPVLRGKGVGKKLVEASCQHLYEKFQLDEVYLLVAPDNVQAINCYEAAGFRYFDTQKGNSRYIHVR